MEKKRFLLDHRHVMRKSLNDLREEPTHEARTTSQCGANKRSFDGEQKEEREREKNKLTKLADVMIGFAGFRRSMCACILQIIKSYIMKIPLIIDPSHANSYTHGCGLMPIILSSQ